jgi:hypothetical protein
MNEAPANPSGPELAGPNPPVAGWPARPEPPGGGWSFARWLTLIALIYTAHIAFIFLFGAHKPVVPRAVAHVPVLELAGHSDELLALNDPTLFALPHQHDFASAGWLQRPVVNQPSFRWTEDPRWLALSADGLGAVFQQFMQTNACAGYPLNFKPVPQLRMPALLIPPVLAQDSVMQIEGELARRLLLSQLSLTNWPYANVIAPSVVQVLVDTTGNVISTVLLPPAIGFTAADQYDPADQRALEVARTLRFKHAPALTVGRIIFNWHTVPPAAAPPATSP